MTTELVVFEQVIDGLFLKGLGSRLTPHCRLRLKGIGIDLDRKLLPAYPFETWMRSLAIAAEELFPSASRDEALFQLGQLLIDGYRETFIGRAMLGLLKVLGPRRTILRAAQNFRSGNNYTEVKIADLGPESMELWLNEVGPYPSFTAGIVHSAVTASGAKGLLVEAFGFDGHACAYRVSWGASGSIGVGGKGDSSAFTKSGSISSR